MPPDDQPLGSLQELEIFGDSPALAPCEEERSSRYQQALAVGEIALAAHELMNLALKTHARMLWPAARGTAAPECSRGTLFAVVQIAGRLQAACMRLQELCS